MYMESVCLMEINSTTIRLDIEKAREIACRENRGILGAIADKLGHKAEGVDVLSISLFYYPFYVGGAKLTYKRVGKLPSRTAVDLAVMECGFGYVQKMRGLPEMNKKAVDSTCVVKCRYTEEESRKRIMEFMQKQGYKIYRSVPSVEFQEFFLVYKPHYACLCKKGSKTFYKIIDAEICERDYMLDIKYKELEFETI